MKLREISEFLTARTKAAMYNRFIDDYEYFDIYDSAVEDMDIERICTYCDEIIIYVE